MNNKPVAWIIDAKMTDCDDNFIWNTGNYPDWQVKDWIPPYTHPVKEQLTDEEIIESLAELEHEQWMKWADTIMQTEKISDVRFARWASCMIPYAELTEEMKEFDREWARKALAILRKASEK